MSPKRRYQSSSVGIGLPPPPSALPPPDYFRPITPAEIAVNPVLTSRKIALPQLASRPHSDCPPGSTDGFQLVPAPLLPPYVKPVVHHSKSAGTAPGSRSKGNRTYRVHSHHTTTSDRSSLSQGIFGLPVAHDCFRHHNEENFEELGGTKILDSLDDGGGIFSVQPTKDPKPRMKITLPSSKPVATIEEMDGIIQVRPASRSSNVPAAHHHSSPRSRTAGGLLCSQVDSGHGHRSQQHQSCSPRGGGGSKRSSAARRVQSTAGGGGRSSTPDLHGFESTSADVGSRLSQLPQRCRKGNQSEYNQLTPAMVESMLHDSLSNLKSADWEEICEGFRQIINFTESYPFQVRSALKKIIWTGLPHLSSSRTKVSRSACQCFKRLYETQKRGMDGEGDKVFSRLLELCGGPSNKFIQEECKEALLAAVANTDPLKSITHIELYGAKHKNGNVREFASYLLNDIMGRHSADKLMSKEYAVRIIPMIVGFLREGQLNTRLNAKDALQKIFTHHSFDAKLRRYVSPESIRHVNDTLKKIRIRQVKK